MSRDVFERKEEDKLKQLQEGLLVGGDFVLYGPCIWRYSDSYWRSFPMQENHFGLLTKKNDPKKAWFEYVNQVKARI